MTQSLPEGHLRGERMTTLKELVKSILFSHQECRALMLPEMSTHIKATLAREDADPALISMCTETLGDILMALHAFESDRPGSTVDDVSYVMFSCLRTVIQMVANRKAGDKNVPVVVSDMISLLRAMTSGHFEQYISKFTEGEDPAAGRLNLVDFVMEFLVMSRDLIEHNVFPPDWLSMILLQNASCLKAVRHLANTIRDSLNNPFEYQAWSNFFTFAVAFVTQPPLQLERFSENKRQKVQALYRDMRREMGSIVKSMWINLGQHKIRFIPEMVGPFLDMTMIPETDLRKEMIPVFFDMMQCEYYSSKTRTEDGGTLDTRRDPSMIKGNFKVGNDVRSVVFCTELVVLLKGIQRFD
jgi:dedicator of cytokinesis protein 1